MSKNVRFKIGDKYIKKGRHEQICTIVDIYKTFNSLDELVGVHYVATHDFMGQKVTEYDVIDTTIARGLI